VGGDHWFEQGDVHGDKKLHRFLPHSEIDEKTLRRKGGGDQAGWFAPSEHIMKYVSDQVADLVHAGGRAGVGSHGQFQGLGYHWELWNMASGKLTAHEALRSATIMGADMIGRAKDVGSIEAGKLADILVMDANPLVNIKNSNTLKYVMKNGGCMMRIRSTSCGRGRRRRASTGSRVIRSRRTGRVGGR
jgi:hypothetical protein